MKVPVLGVVGLEVGGSRAAPVRGLSLSHTALQMTLKEGGTVRGEFFCGIS